jgi:hypothetical protein
MKLLISFIIASVVSLAITSCSIANPLAVVPPSLLGEGAVTINMNVSSAPRVSKALNFTYTPNAAVSVMVIASNTATGSYKSASSTIVNGISRKIEGIIGKNRISRKIEGIIGKNLGCK